LIKRDSKCKEQSGNNAFFFFLRRYNFKEFLAFSANSFHLGWWKGNNAYTIYLLTFFFKGITT
jgi:hypothetical protein